MEQYLHINLEKYLIQNLFFFFFFFFLPSGDGGIGSWNGLRKVQEI